MLIKELFIDEGILIVTPEGPLAEADFTSLATDVDPYIEKHHQRIAKVAVVTDSGVLSILPQIASHFVAAEIKHFPYQEKKVALDWLKSVFA